MELGQFGLLKSNLARGLSSFCLVVPHDAKRRNGCQHRLNSQQYLSFLRHVCSRFRICG